MTDRVASRDSILVAIAQQAQHIFEFLLVAYALLWIGTVFNRI